MQQRGIDQILCLREAPARWARARHFPPPGDPTHTPIPTCFGPWHNGAGHLVTFYMCPGYWSIIDPLEEDLSEPPPMQFRLHRALRESFTSPNLPIPPLPAYRKLPLDSGPTGRPHAPMVLRYICNVYHNTPITRGHTPSHSSNQVHYPGTYARLAQSPS